MSHRYVAVQWNRRKLVYDAILVLTLVAYNQLFPIVARLIIDPAQVPNSQVLAMRALGTAAFLMISFILAIGPLARLSPQTFKPLLYNRRHFGVILFVVGVLHARQVLGFYQSNGSLSPLESFFTYDGEFARSSVPFQYFGALALFIFGVMAATSHDFWQKVIGARVWKNLHMAVYLAYTLVIAHVAFGALHDQASLAHAAIYVGVALTVGGLQLFAALAGRERDRGVTTRDGVIAGGSVDDLPSDRPTGLTGTRGERIALVKHNGKVSALSAVCAHQGGPLDEGRIIDDCLTCPWHGWQYRPADGVSPPPFEERVATHQVRIDERGQVHVQSEACGPHAPATPVACPDTTEAPPGSDEDFFVGYLSMSRRDAARSLKTAAGAALLFVALGLGLGLTQSRGGDLLQPWRRGESFRGLLQATPYPHVLYRDERGDVATLFLVSGGKFSTGLPSELVGMGVEVNGLLLQRDSSRMMAGVVITAAAIEADDLQTLGASTTADLGSRVLVGEVVDSKCFFGAMRPGKGQTHRACAQVCIEGGIPPFLVVFDEEGTERHVLLVDEGGNVVNEAMLTFAGEAVTIRGALSQRAGVWRLQIDPGSIAAE